MGPYHLFTIQATSDSDAIIYHILARNSFLQLVMRTLDDTQIPFSALVETAPVKRATLVYHLNKLVEAGVINLAFEREEKMYEISCQFKQNVYKILEEYFPDESN